jgi:3-phosphoshikimate 1-carboxyvinyltransferase
LKPNTLITIPNAPYCGEYFVPGDKSISHRALILGAISTADVTIQNLNNGEDVQATLEALMALGADIHKQDETIICRKSSWGNPNTPLFMGNSGTSARLLLGLVAGAGLKAIFSGDESLSKRPMGRVIDPLKQMGIVVEEGAINLPLAVEGPSNVNPITYLLPVASAQVESALLIAGSFSQQPIEVINPFQTRDHTLRMMQYLGFAVSKQEHTITISSRGHTFKNERIIIPYDPSAAAFWIVGALITEGSNSTIKNILYNPYRAHFVNVLLKMGAKIRVFNERSQCGEPIADIEVFYTADLTGIETEAYEAPLLIDEFPILSVAAAMATGISQFKGLRELRFKESDRLTKIEEMLGVFGIQSKIVNDDLIVYGQTFQQNNTTQIYFNAEHDHRMAMSALILGRALKTDINVKGIETINSSFPGFLAQFYG